METGSPDPRQCGNAPRTRQAWPPQQTCRGHLLCATPCTEDGPHFCVFAMREHREEGENKGTSPPGASGCASGHRGSVAITVCIASREQGVGDRGAGGLKCTPSTNLAHVADFPWTGSRVSALGTQTAANEFPLLFA